MRLVLHLGRAAVIFWVAAILLPAAVVQVSAVAQHSSPETALLGVSTAADDGRSHLGGVTATVHGVEDDVHRIVARLRLETERFIAQLP